MVFGAVIYRLVIQLALSAGLEVNDMKLISAVLVVVALLLPKWKGFQKIVKSFKRTPAPVTESKEEVRTNA